MATADERSTVTLHSRRPAGAASPLEDEQVLRTVHATIEGIAERMGISLVSIDWAERSVTITLGAPSLVALTFAAELRRVTDAWHRGKFGTPIWSDRP